MVELDQRRVSPALLRVVLVDDSARSSDPLATELRRAGHEVVLDRVESEDALAIRLTDTATDVVFTTSGTPSPPVVLETVRQVRPTVPVILLTESPDQQGAVASTRAGIENVVSLDDLGRVADAVRTALEVRRPLGRLSPRQIEVLRLIAQGLTTRQMAQRLALSGKTVETHRSAVAQRLGIRELAGLVRYAVRVGLASQCPPYDGRKRDGGGGQGIRRTFPVVRRASSSL